MTLSELVLVRFTPTQYKSMKKLAAKSGVSLAGWIRAVTDAATAKRISVGVQARKRRGR